MKHLLLSLVFFATTLLGQEQTFTNYLEVRTSEYREVIPDEIYLRIRIDEDDYRNESLKDLESDMMKILRNLKIEKNLTVISSGSEFNDRLFKKNEAGLIKEYELLVNDDQTATAVLKDLQEIGISSIYISKLDISNIEEIKLELLAEAIKTAKKKAEIMLNAAGVRGAAIPIFMQEQQVYIPMPELRMMSKGVASGISADYGAVINQTEELLEFKPIAVGSAILMRFQL